VVSVAFSPDGKYLLSGSSDRSVVVWEVSSGRKVNSWQAHNGHVNSVSFSADGRQVATGGSDGAINLWEWPGAVLLTTFTNLGGYAAFDPADTRLFTGFGPNSKAGGSSNKVELLRLITPTSPERAAQFHTVSWAFAAPNPQGDLVAVGSRYADVQLLDLSGRLLHRLDESKGALSLAFSPNSDILALCSGNFGKRPENEIRIHETATGRLLVTLTNHTSRVWSLAFSSDGRWLASASSAQTVRLLDVATWREANRFRGHGSEVWTVAFSPDAKLLASGGKDTTVRFWKAETADSAKRIDDALVDYSNNPSPRFLNRESLFAARLAGGGRAHVGIGAFTAGNCCTSFPPRSGVWGKCAGNHHPYAGLDGSGLEVLGSA
jgi:WD40 repeat protein